MIDQTNKKTIKKHLSELDKFSLGFELNVPWNQASQTVHIRPIKR